ncbi:alpha/beta fold hydrolase [Phreatobacter stygius]|uniref:alpha/beta fold hydrolase n=1 Tax=Phreatobacter stygius TaxID=1940610 RepID=UPI001476F5CC|nr:alpha/beta fold hydrolase [Phreatobacter stygius]
MLHAGGERRRVWHPVMEHLARHGCRAIAYDQRGHGDSIKGRAFALPAYGEDTIDMIARLTMPVVVGASLGGFAALLALADAATEANVAGLVLVDVLPDPDPRRTLRFLAPLGMDTSPLVADILGRRDQLRQITRRLSLPILAIRAGASAGIRDSDADRFLELAPQAQVASVAGAGHLIARDKPVELAALLADFQRSDAVRDRRTRGPRSAG